MKDILLTGGMGSGKTTLGNALMVTNPGMNYIYVSKYSVRIPMTLISTSRPDMLSLHKSGYIDTVLANQDIDLVAFSRQEMDNYGGKISQIFGDTIIAELVLKAALQDVQNLVDSVPKAVNVRCLKERNFYVVNLRCEPETQLQRRLRERKDIDPPERSSLKRQIKKTNAYFAGFHC